MGAIDEPVSGVRAEAGLSATQGALARAAQSSDGAPDVLPLMFAALRRKWMWLVFASPMVGALALAATYLVQPTFTARTSFLPPQGAQSAAASALASLGPLAGLVGGGQARSPGEQYVALMQSVTVADRMVDQFKLMDVYEAKMRVDARRALGDRMRVVLGRKDGLITVEVDDHDPRRAADMANRLVEELRRMTSSLAVSEAQQRRVFFEQLLGQTREKLAQAQAALQSSGFDPGALKAEPKAAADSYARLRADVTAAEVRLQGLRGNLTDESPEVRQQLSLLAALRAQLSAAERATTASSGAGYVGRYREFKYQETLFDLYARQFEIARADEAREGALVQVVDPALPPERKTRPRRGQIAIVTTLLAALAICLLIVVPAAWRAGWKPSGADSADPPVR